MRIGLYGGSFDPVHRGHLMVAQAALEELALEQLIFIPTLQSPFKPDCRPADGSLRLRWLRLALAGQMRCKVDAIELARGEVRYTIDTVRSFVRRYPKADLLLLIGSDQVPHLPYWREAESLAGLVKFVVIPRPGYPSISLPLSYRLRHLRGWPMDISSSEIRMRVRSGLPVYHLVPKEVAEDFASLQPYQDKGLTA
ncbi:MAG: nicotinate (nicotinamide) nucleotide adenylyltransferase [Verrucomicrobiota bacterium]